MPFCVVNIEHTTDPKGHNDPDDFIQILRGEVLKVAAGNSLIAAHYLAPIDASDIEEIATCKCGRMFSSAEHAHFTQAQFAQELLVAEDRLRMEEEGTKAHAAAAERVEEIKKQIATGQKKHVPVVAKETVKA